MSNNTEQIKREIEENRLILEEKYALAMTAARKIVEKYEELTVAEENRDTRGGNKEIARHEIAESCFNATVKKYFFFLNGYDAAVEKVLALYDGLVSVACAKEAKKARAQAEKLEEHERYKRDKLFDVIRYINGVEDMYSEYVSEKFNEKELDTISKINQEAQETVGTQSEGLVENFEGTDEPSSNQNQRCNQQHLIPNDIVKGSGTQEGYRIAPASIDISGIVEDAVSLAMSKFNSAFEKRINSVTVGYSEKTGLQSSSEDVLNMHSELVNFELEIANKLSELVKKLKDTSEQMIEIGSAYMQLSATQRNIADKQRALGEEQSMLVCKIEEIQGLQKDVLHRQTALSEEQTLLGEGQASLNEQQEQLSVLNESILQAERAVAESSNEILAAHKEILSLQQSAVNSGVKSLELQRAITAKQKEVTELQKAAMSEHKQVKRKAFK